MIKMPLKKIYNNDRKKLEVGPRETPQPTGHWWKITSKKARENTHETMKKV